jgi:hypothetical protein
VGETVGHRPSFDQDRFKHAINIFAHFAVREADYRESTVSELPIAFHVCCRVMGVAVDFDDQSNRWAKEIDDVGLKNDLPAEFQAIELR